MKKFTLVYFTLAVTLIVIVSRQKTQATPLFFDKLQRLFGGGSGGGGNSGGGYGQRPNKNPWNGGSQYQKQKKFPWDIFGIFGYKNVIRPGGRPNGGPVRPPRPPRPGPTFRPINPIRPVTFRPTNRPTFRPTVTGRPPFFPPTTTWPNNCNCGWDIVNQNGQPQLVDTNGPQIVTAPPSVNNQQQQVLVTAAPPSVVLGKPGGAALPPPISGSGGVVPTTQTPPSSFRNSVRTPLNLGGGTFNAAQQFYPASDFPDNLPKYSPNLPARRRRPLTTAVPNLNDFGSNSVTTPDATTVTNSIDVEEFEIDELQETTTFLPRQNRNRDLDNNVLLQPDFGVDVLEEPLAEPLNTHGDGWIPMTPQEVNQVFDKGSSTTEKPSLPPPPFLENQPRAPKVLQWFDNPYFIQQEPKKPLTNNLQNEIEISKTKLHDISPEKVKPEKISISQNPSAFEKSVHNLATLAYATEENFEESTEQISAKNDDLITDNPLKKPKSISSLFNWGSTGDVQTETTTEFSEFSSNFWQQTTTPTTAKPVVNGWFMKLLDSNQTIGENEINEQPLQLNKMSEKPLEVNVPQVKDVKFFEPVVNTEDPIFNWVWTDVNDDAEYIGEFHDDDLRDPDMTTIGTGTAAVLDEKFPYPTLEPGFDLLSDDWFQNQVENRTIIPNHQDLLYEDDHDNEILEEEKMLATTSDKFMLYYPISGTPFLSFTPKLEIASIVKK